MRCEEYQTTLICPNCGATDEMSRTLAYRDISHDMNMTAIAPRPAYECRSCRKAGLDVLGIVFKLCSVRS